MHSCLAFATTALAESMYLIANQKGVPLSVQMLVDCYPGDEGCEGGWPGTAIMTANDVGGWPSEVNYPYIGKVEDCTASRIEIDDLVPGTKPVNFGAGGGKDFIIQSLQYGPVISFVSSTSKNFWYYQSGVISECDPNLKADHVVLIVGYVLKDGIPSYKVKNSWGPGKSCHDYFIILIYALRW
jgi:Papain family cysteine protease